MAWDAVAGADKYEFQWMRSGGTEGWAVASDSLAGTAARKKGLQPSTGYTFRVRASTGGVWGAFSAPSEVTSTITPLCGNFSNLLGTELVNQKGEVVSIGAVNGGGLVLLYFSASWCPPCRQFTPMLAEFYAAQKARGKNVEIIFVSSDRDPQSFLEYFTTHHGAWLALPYASNNRQSASAYFKVGRRRAGRGLSGGGG